MKNIVKIASNGLILSFFINFLIMIYYEYFSVGEVSSFYFSIYFPSLITVISIVLFFLYSYYEKGFSRIIIAHLDKLVYFDHEFLLLFAGIGSIITIYGFYLVPYWFNIGITIIILFIILFFIFVLIKYWMKQRIYFNLFRVNQILIKMNADNNNSIDIQYYMNLVFKNIDHSLGDGLELNIEHETFDYSKLKYTLINYLPQYLKCGNRAQLEISIRHIQSMLNSVDFTDKIEWKRFKKASVMLSEEITVFLKENKFNLTYAKIEKKRDTIFRNRNVIIQFFAYVIIPLILYFFKTIYNNFLKIH